VIDHEHFHRLLSGVDPESDFLNCLKDRRSNIPQAQDPGGKYVSSRHGVSPGLLANASYITRFQPATPSVIATLFGIGNPGKN